ncbi:hypothetical protein CEXT_614491 [Caerostris extrusa]|uniref:Uncharacterized protein n=1 Tax=Caerostris extrusa TaxID=172846 RepID=A0AAV4PRB4_CAEEX|nr:hypothetical protein CEXT_614491 [Caerostris extrusa]
MDARGNGKFVRETISWHFNQELQTRNERSSKQRVPIRIKRCATSAPALIGQIRSVSFGTERPSGVQ